MLQGYSYMDGLCSEALSWYNQVSSPKPSAAYIKNVSDLIKGLKSSGVWNNLDRFWIFATEQQTHARVDIKNLRSLTEVSSPSWTALQGYSGDGATSYLNTNMRSDQGTNYLQNSGSIGTYVRSHISGNTIEMGVSGVGNIEGSLIQVWNTSGFFGIRVNNSSVGNLSTTVSTSKGLSVVNRSGASALQLYKNGIQLTANTSSSTAPVAFNFTVLARNSGNSILSYSPSQVSAAFIGGSLSDSQQLSLYNSFQKFATAQGFNV